MAGIEIPPAKDAAAPNALDYNIAYFTNTFLPFVGGVSNSVNLYAQYLREVGQHVLIYAPSYADHTEDTPGVRRMVSLPSPSGGEFSIPMPGSLKPMLDFAGDDFDLIHVHHPFLLGETGLRMARSERIPLVFTYHTQYEHYTHNVPFDEETSAKAIIRHATDFCEMCDLVIAPTHGMEALLRSRGVTTQIEVLPSGIEWARYRNADAAAARQKLHIAPGQKLLLHVGRLSEEKNLEYLFAAMAEVLEVVPDCVFAVAGTGPDEAKLRAPFNDLSPQAANHVQFLGTVTGDDLIALYAAADLFVFASTSETQGMVLVEAMAGGAPVIALDADAMRDIVRDTENGRLLPAPTPSEAFARAVIEALQRDDLRSQWSECARKTSQAYDMPKLAQQLLGHYHSLKQIPRHRLKKRTMTFGLVRSYLATIWEEFTL